LLLREDPEGKDPEGRGLEGGKEGLSHGLKAPRRRWERVRVRGEEEPRKLFWFKFKI
jgi:hypothetical protein